jgi:hypothetical protein
MGVENNISEDAGATKGSEPMIPLSVVMDIIANLKQTFITADEARAIAKEELPSEFRNLDSFPNTGATKEAGRVLKLGIGAPGIPATAYWGRISGIDYEGTPTLYYGLFFREYDETGTIVPVGSEVIPLPEGHTLKLTVDVARWI